jgi:hypothetical protein
MANAGDTSRDEQLTRLQVQVDDLEALLAHHDEHGWEKPDEEGHGLRRLLQAGQQLARRKGERYTPEAELLRRLQQAEQERGDNDS